MIEVILLERIERLGTLGQLVKVRPGYARNLLLPKKKALRATKANLELFEKQRAQLEAKNAALRVEAEVEAKSVDGIKVVVIRQASETGQLFGSVTARDVAEAAKTAGHKIERQQVQIDTPIKALGIYPVKIKLHPEVNAKITINVARSAEEAVVQEQKGAAVIKAAEKAEAVAVEEAKAAAEASLGGAAPSSEATEEAKPAKAKKAKAKSEDKADSEEPKKAKKSKKAAAE